MIQFNNILKPCWSSDVALEQKHILTELIKSMVLVEGGTFIMGATTEQENDAYRDETPIHSVTLSDFYIGKYEVTQEEWHAVMGKNPSYFKGEKNPVENVSYRDCQEFIEKLNKLTGLNFSLPTEAQWEYAARGGLNSCGYKYSGSNDLNSIAWCKNNSGGNTHPVGQKTPNELGLYDMSGNLWEWCIDAWYKYNDSSVINPMYDGEASAFRMKRGGCWLDNDCRVSDRDIASPNGYSDCLGLRIVLNI